MAGSRLEKIGSIFTRMRGLLTSGAVKEIDKPLWYDIYEAFPPRQSPEYSRPEPTDHVRNILYAEDIIRAQFYKIYGNPDVVDLQNEKVKTTCQKFVEKYLQLLAAGKDKAEVFHLTTEALKGEGIRLRTVEEIRKEQEKLRPPVNKESETVQPISAKDVFGRIAEKDRSGEEVVDHGSEEYR